MCVGHVYVGRNRTDQSVNGSDGGERVDRTKTEDAFIWHVGRATDQISRVTLGHLVVADVVACHPPALKLTKHARDLLRAGGGLQLKREEDLRTVGGVVPVYELRHLARVYDRVECEKAKETKTWPGSPCDDEEGA